jgi:hypothetical protein
MFSKSKLPQSLIDAVSNIVENAPVKIPTSTGTKVLGRSYGNSAKAHQDQTKKDIDNLKGPKDKEMKEELKGNQDKIDVNHNNKIDAQDFAILRGKKKKMKEGYDFASRLIYSISEEAQLEKEINEVLSKDASAGDWIHDFIHSDNPKFAGKSKAKRQKMALAAYYAKQRNEGYENSKEDKEEDAKEAKKRGMSMAKWEKSAEDKKQDKKEMKEENYAMADGPITTDTLAGRVDGGKPNSFKSFKLRVNPADKEGDGSVREPACEEPEETTARTSIKARGGEVEVKKGEVVGTVHKEETELTEETPAKNTDIADKSYLKDMGKKPTIKSDLKNFKNFLTGKKETNEEVESIEERDEGKPGKMFAKIAAKAAKEYGSKEAGNRVAGAIRKKVLAKEGAVEEAKTLSPGQDDAPFEKPYTTTPKNVKDKSGAVHTPMSRAKDLARSAMKRLKTEMLGKAPGNN